MTIDEQAVLAEAMSMLASEVAALAAQASGPMAAVVTSVQACIGAAASQLREAELFTRSAPDGDLLEDATGDLAALRIDLNAGNRMDWQNVTSWLAPVGRRWDIAVLANLPPDGSWSGRRSFSTPSTRQAAPERQVSWKVLGETFRRLEAGGYIARREMTRVPRETATGYSLRGTAWSPRLPC